ncbi:YtcA family lipoprotein [Xanthobacter sp. V3C-3]|uniref:YtcA family lipoprotein n=1 Tax=Xanthobacter lutulentifluminis TaxID=3119935 RepID=UPI00372B0464
MSHPLIRDRRRRPSCPPAIERRQADNRAAERLAAVGLLAVSLGGCVPGGAPSIPFFGAFFPAWLLCAFIGIVGAVLVRVALIRLGIDDLLPARLPVYVCIAAGIGFLVSIVSFGR